MENRWNITNIQLLDLPINRGHEDQKKCRYLFYLILSDPGHQGPGKSYWNKGEASEYIILKFCFKSDHLGYDTRNFMPCPDPEAKRTFSENNKR
jgi:hypothetical protein